MIANPAIAEPHPPMPDLYIDADACPVKDEVIRVAERHRLIRTNTTTPTLKDQRSGRYTAADDRAVTHIAHAPARPTHGAAA